MAFCTSCGQPLRGEGVFCGSCGASANPMTEPPNRDRETDSVPHRQQRYFLVVAGLLVLIVAGAAIGWAVSGSAERSGEPTSLPMRSAQSASTTVLETNSFELTVSLRAGESVVVATAPASGLSRETADTAGVAAEVGGSFLTVSAGIATTPGEVIHHILTNGCVESDCGQDVELVVTVAVEEIQNSAEATPLTTPDPARVVEGDAAGTFVASGEVVVLAIDDFDPDAAAEELGVALIGGIPSAGIWQFYAEDSAVLDSLGDRLGVLDVVPHVLADFSAESEVYPSDWADDDPRGRWHLEMIGAPEMWAMRTSAPDVTVGVVDWGIWDGHEDLNVTSRTGVCVGDGCRHFIEGRIHGTHVAGLACGEGSIDGPSAGLVGAAWGCPLAAYDLVGGDLYLGELGKPVTSSLDIVLGMMAVVDGGADVVNLSLGIAFDYAGCAEGTPERLSVARSVAATYGQAIRYATDLRFRQGRPDVVWVVAAGNECFDARGQAPARLSLDYDNVVTVASVDADGSLSAFSNWGAAVSVAAPGGTYWDSETARPSGVWSAMHEDCGSSGCRSTYGMLSGTSMAAPIVAGVAALLRQEAPDASAADVARCLASSERTVENRASYVTDANGNQLLREPRDALDISLLWVLDAPAAYRCIAAPSEFSWSISGIDGLPWRVGMDEAVTFVSRFFGDPDWTYNTTQDVGQWCSRTETHFSWADGPRLIFDDHYELVGIEPNGTTSDEGIASPLRLDDARALFGEGGIGEDPQWGWPVWRYDFAESGTVLTGFVYPWEDPPTIPWELVALRLGLPGHETDCAPVGT